MFTNYLKLYLENIAMRSNIEEARLYKTVTTRGMRDVTTLTLTAAYTISDDEGDVMVIDPGGASRNVTLPAAASHKGRVIWIVNTADAAEDLVLKDVSTTVDTISQNERGWVVSDGANWFGVTGAQT